MNPNMEEFRLHRDKLEVQYRQADYRNGSGMPAKELAEACTKAYWAAPSLQEGAGEAMRCYMENVRVTCCPDDIFADLFEICNPVVKIRAGLLEQHRTYDPQAKRAIDGMAFFANHDFNHTLPDWEHLFRAGVSGIAEEARLALQSHELGVEQKAFYTSVAETYSGFSVLLDHLAQAAEDAGSVNSRFAAENLRTLAENAPQTMAQAMQLMFVYYRLQEHVDGIRDRSAGRLDQLMQPFYAKDLADGIPEETLREQLRYFLYKWYCQRVSNNMPITLGGVGKDGHDACNAFTRMLLEIYREQDIPDPKLQLLCTPDMPEDILELALDCIRRGSNSIVLVNDAIVTESLVRIGEKAEDAANHAMIGCYEQGAVGKELPCSCNGAIHMPMAVEAAMNRGYSFAGNPVGITKKGPEEYKDFADFYEAVKAELKEWARLARQEISTIEADYPKIIQTPLFSGTFRCCMERGKDAYGGGMIYPNSSICAFGIGTIADELIAIRKAVFEDGRVTLPELACLLKNNWKDSGTLREWMTNVCPKYGNNEEEPDALAVELANMMASEIDGKPNGWGGVFRYGMFSIDWRMNYGAALGASAEGRFAGEPTSKNMAASVGMDKKGITASILSACRFDNAAISDGTALDLHIHPTAAAGEEGMNVLKSLVRIFMRRGGFAVQMNIVGPETLREAQRHPEQYRNLQIRLCGWNVYFLELDAASQEDLIRSMEAAS